jgi:hypothetical protein
MAQMNNRTKTKKRTAAEAKYVRSMRKRSAFDLVDKGEAEIIDVADYPEPLRRFLRRERRMVHVELSPSDKRQLEQTGRELGISPDQLVKRWIEDQLKRDTG